MTIKKNNYKNLYDCIVTDQVPENEIAEYFKDKGFYNYYKKRIKKFDVEG